MHVVETHLQNSPEFSTLPDFSARKSSWCVGTLHILVLPIGRSRNGCLPAHLHCNLALTRQVAFMQTPGWTTQCRAGICTLADGNWEYLYERSRSARSASLNHLRTRSIMTAAGVLYRSACSRAKPELALEVKYFGPVTFHGIPVLMSSKCLVPVIHRQLREAPFGSKSRARRVDPRWQYRRGSNASYPCDI